MTIRRLALLILSGLLLTLLACGDDDPTGPAPVVYNLYVNVVDGDDSATGDQDAPLKTITTALARAEPGERIKVAPGTYDAASGEVFPLEPVGVELIGDEGNKGEGDTPTLIRGGVTTLSAYACTVLPGSDTVVAGFSLCNPGPAYHQTYCVFMMTPSKNITLRNCTIANCAANTIGTGAAIQVNDADSLLISGNRLIDNVGAGIEFHLGGAGSVVEDNEIRGNAFGVIYNSPVDRPDLGGGASGSRGGNIICCNSLYDLMWPNSIPNSPNHDVAADISGTTAPWRSPRLDRRGGRSLHFRWTLERGLTGFVAC